MKNTNALKKLTTVTIVTFGILIFAFFANVFFKNVARANKLIVVIDSGQMRYTELGDSVFGLQYEILRAFADSNEMKLQILKNNDLKQSIDMLLDSKCDLVAIPIPKTTQYIDQVEFTLPLLSMRQVLVQIPDSLGHVKKIQYELANDTITVPVNSPQIQRIRNLSDEIADTIFIVEIPNVTTDDLVAQVAQGRYKYTICGAQLAQKLKKDFPVIDISMPIDFEQPYSWAVNKKNYKLLQKLNGFLEKFFKSDAYKVIYEKYE
ncbi:MAG: transporter substrate-binding domain-containing protein [Paludibacter sp.]|nr:transporter substrate-binding domain-containing protein [Paludibacter sp.]